MRRPFFVANWKMNKKQTEVGPFLTQFLESLESGTDADIAIAPQAVHLGHLGALVQSTAVQVAVQNSGPDAAGAFTGDVSPVAAKELGATWSIVGHSERRHVFKEPPAITAKRVGAASKEGLGVVYCVGETLEERKAGRTKQVVFEQLTALTDVKRITIAYEPVWAIGTGENATPAQAAEVHGWIRGWLRERFGTGTADGTRILYGGSVKPENAKELMGEPDIDGFLIGGASLDPVSFARIVRIGLECRALGVRS